MNISFTKKELSVLWDEIGMLVENADIREQEGDTSMLDTDITIRSVYEKLRAARQKLHQNKPQGLTREENRQRFFDTFNGKNKSKWDRFRD